MYIKIILPKEAEGKAEGSYLNTDKIVELFYNIAEKKYVAVCNPQMAYIISKADYEKLVGKKCALVEEMKGKKKK